MRASSKVQELLLLPFCNNSIQLTKVRADGPKGPSAKNEGVNINYRKESIIETDRINPLILVYSYCVSVKSNTL